MGSGLGCEVAGHAERHLEDSGCCHLGGRSVVYLNDFEDPEDVSGVVAVLARYTVLPLVVDGRGQTALLCTRHDAVPVMLLPGSGVVKGAAFPIDQRGLHVGMLVDAARRHEREHHR